MLFFSDIKEFRRFIKRGIGHYVQFREERERLKDEIDSIIEDMIQAILNLN